MMIDQNLARRRRQYGLSHSINTADSIEIQTTYHARFRYQLIGKLFITIIQKYVFTTGHPTQKIRESIGDNNVHILVLRIEEMP